jgi:adenosylhomocysteine nucleosidase
VTSVRPTAASPLAVIGAMPEEVAPLLAAASGVRETGEGPYRWHLGRLDGVPVALAVCGVGKVNAAALTQALLAGGAAGVLFTGVAGGVDPDLSVGDIVVAHDAVQHDVDVTGLGYEPGRVPGEPLVWCADPDLRDRVAAAAREVAAEAAAQAAAEAGAEAAAEAAVRVVVGRVASGDTFVADPRRVADLRARFGAACAEMEGAAVAQVCARWGVPWAIVRSVSDTADHGAEADFRAFTVVAAERAVEVVRRTLRGLA